jgi:hypothetical protein
MKSRWQTYFAAMTFINMLTIWAYFVCTLRWQMLTREIFYYIWWDGWNVAILLIGWGIHDHNNTPEFSSFEMFLYIWVPLFGTIGLYLKMTLIVVLAHKLRSWLHCRRKQLTR